MVARTDLVTDPKIRASLLLARRGQAYYSRKLAELSDRCFDGPSLLNGWDRRHLVAHVGLNARALTHLTEWAASGIVNPMYESPGQRDEEIEFASTLPVQALRNLSDHAAIHLSVEWRDLPDAAWAIEVVTALGRTVPVSDTVWMRIREVWMHAVDLDNGGSIGDFPPELVDSMLADILAAWSRRRVAESLPRFEFAPTDRNPLPRQELPQTLTITGTAVDLLTWASGRGGGNVVRSDGYDVPTAPRWL